jgi:hypothetical protein
MKKLLLYLLLPAGLSSYAQTRPRPVSPEKVKEAFSWVDSVFHGSSFSFEVTEFDFPADIREILLKFNNAIAANKDWFAAYSSHATAGQPLPYDEKFGITREEYDRIKNMDRLHPALKVVDTLKITILRQDEKISFSGEGDGRILDYLEFNLRTNELIFAGDNIPFSPGINMTSAIAYSLVNTQRWRLQTTDVNKSLQANQLTARVVEIELGLHQPGNKPLLRIQYQDMENGISHANLDLSGFITN